MYNIKERLKSSGWTVPSSSDGTTYNASGDQITSSGSGAGGLANSLAWFRVRDPAGVREFTFQRSSSDNTSWRVKYSAAAKFSGGSPSATVTPYATDEAICVGGGTDASPTMGTFYTTDGSYRQHLMADNAAPYGWYSVVYVNGTGAECQGSLMMDPMTGAPGSDSDSVVIFVATNSTSFSAGTTSTHLTGHSGPGKAWYQFGTGSQAFQSVCGLMYHGYTTANVMISPNSVGVNPHSGNDDLLPLPWVRASTMSGPNGFKGFSSFMRWNGVSRTTGTTFTTSATRDRFVVSHVNLPWADANGTPLV